MIQPQENTLVMPRRLSERIHAVPAPKTSLVRFVDAADVPLALVSRDGRITSMNGPARDFFVGRSGIELRDAVETIARHVLGDRRRPDGSPNRSELIETMHHRFVVTIVPAGNDLATQDVGAMVTIRRDALEAQGPELTEQGLAKRFGLTAQEARVAVLLADHRSNREIAARLGVSVHTARHHTERVLGKLHIHSRYDVRRVVG